MGVTERDYMIMWEKRRNTECNLMFRSNLSWLEAQKQFLTD